MRIVVHPSWSDVLRWVIPPSEGAVYCGIAIGPGSDEGIVRVNDFPLQAGRVLPLQSDKYTITKVRPLKSQIVTGVDTGLDCIQSLELILFTNPGELGATIPRADGYFFAPNFLASGALAPVLSVPFVGRRQALFTISSQDLGAGTFSYTIYGVKYDRTSNRIFRYPLHVATLVTLSTSRTYAFYIGGMDNAEIWDALDLRLGVANGFNFAVGCQTLGEDGAY